MIISKILRNIPSPKKTIVTGNHLGRSDFDFSANSKEGARSDQKEAAVMIPAAAPCIIARNLLLTSLTKNTTAEPTSVHSHVNMPANNA